MPVAEPRSMRRANPSGAKKVPKYGNRKTVVDGVTFDSAKEARRYGELKLLERAGQIRNLEVQPRFPLAVNGVTVAHYVGDFSYVEAKAQVIEDVKSAITRKLPVYRLKAKMFAAQYGFQIREV